MPAGVYLMIKWEYELTFLFFLAQEKLHKRYVIIIIIILMSLLHLLIYCYHYLQ